VKPLTLGHATPPRLIRRLEHQLERNMNLKYYSHPRVPGYALCGHCVMVARDGLCEKGEICYSSETAIHVHVARLLFLVRDPVGWCWDRGALWRGTEFIARMMCGPMESWWFVIDGYTAYNKDNGDNEEGNSICRVETWRRILKSTAGICLCCMRMRTGPLVGDGDAAVLRAWLHGED
jgi:hypothetical protein